MGATNDTSRSDHGLYLQGVETMIVSQCLGVNCQETLSFLDIVT